MWTCVLRSRLWTYPTCSCCISYVLSRQGQWVPHHLAITPQSQYIHQIYNLVEYKLRSKKMKKEGYPTYILVLVTPYGCFDHTRNPNARLVFLLELYTTTTGQWSADRPRCHRPCHYRYTLVKMESPLDWNCHTATLDTLLNFWWASHVAQVTWLDVEKL